MKKRGQISVEYLIVVSFVGFLTVSVLGFALIYSAQIKDRLHFYQLENYAAKVISSAEKVYYAGEPSLTTLTVYMPAGVTSAEVGQNELIFNISTSSGGTVIAYTSDVPLSGDLSYSEGVQRIQISAQSNSALISNL